MSTSDTAVRKNFGPAPAEAVSVRLVPLRTTRFVSTTQFVLPSEVTLCNWYCLPSSHANDTDTLVPALNQVEIFGSEFALNGLVPASDSFRLEMPSPSASAFGLSALAP